MRASFLWYWPVFDMSHQLAIGNRKGKSKAQRYLNDINYLIDLKILFQIKSVEYQF